jgi:cytidylate kinase
MSKKIIIAIDGFSSCGKSTIAKDLARKIGYRYVDTGAMYRAVTLFFLNNQIEFHHLDLVNESLKNISINFRIDEITQSQITMMNGEDVEDIIRVNPRIASAVSDVSAISEVRRFLVKQQQAMGSEKGVVMDGRDIGTVVFPKAELKLFITAEPNIRAQRRLDELKVKGQNTTFDEVLANLAKRDYIDSNREDSPLRKADDAIEIDNSFIDKEEQLDLIIKLVNERMGTAI